MTRFVDSSEDLTPPAGFGYVAADAGLVEIRLPRTTDAAVLVEPVAGRFGEDPSVRLALLLKARDVLDADIRRYGLPV